jgi:hypothetical protein
MSRCTWCFQSALVRLDINRAGEDAAANFERALSLSSAYELDPWRLNLTAFTALLSAVGNSANPPAPHHGHCPATEATFSRHLAALLERPAHLLWVLAATAQPQLSSGMQAQWCLLARALAEALPAASDDAAAASRMAGVRAFAEGAAGAAAPEAAALVAPLVAAAAAEILAPLWPHLACPTELVSGLESLPSHDATLAVAALWHHVPADAARVVPRALEEWPRDDRGGLCGVGAAEADMLAVVKALSSASDAAARRGSSKSSALDCCAASLPHVPQQACAALVHWAIAGGPCPGAPWGQGACPGAPDALPLHPRVQLQLLESAEELGELALSCDCVRAARRLRAWRVLDTALRSADTPATADSAAEVITAGLLVMQEPDEAWGMVQEAEMAQADGPALVAAGLLRSGSSACAISEAVHGVVAAFEAGSDDDLVQSALQSVYRKHVEGALEHLHEASADDPAGAQALWGIEKAVDSLSGEAVQGLSGLEALRDAVLAPIEAAHACATGAQLQHPLMRALVQLHADLVQPGRWGHVGGRGGGSVLQLQTRAALASGYGDAVVPNESDVSSAAAARAFLDRLAGEAASIEQLHALYATLAGVWRFGDAFAADADSAGAPACVRMHESCCTLASAFARGGHVLQCANMLHLRHPVSVDTKGRVPLMLPHEVEQVAGWVRDAAGPVAAVAAALGSETAAAVAQAVQELASTQLLEHAASASVDAVAAAVLLHGLTLLPVKRLQAALCAGSGRHTAVAAARALPHVSTAPGCTLVARRVESAFVSLLVALCASGSGGAILLAAELAADYICLHPELRLVSGEVAALKQYLRACRARLVAAGPPARCSDEAWAEVAETLLPRVGCVDAVAGIDVAIEAVEHACVNKF